MAFVGISNWVLDPAKMNRGIMVTRDDPGIYELVLSARLFHITLCFYLNIVFTQRNLLIRW